MTLAQLAQVLGLPPRQVRYLIAESVIPPARTLGRGGDGFDDTHVAAGLAFKALAAEGYGVRKSKALLDARAMMAAMVVDRDTRVGRRDLRFGPLAVSVRPAELAQLSESQLEAVLAAVRDKLSALRSAHLAPDAASPPGPATRRKTA